MSDIIKNTDMFFTSGDSTGCFLYRTKYPAEMLGKPYHVGFPTNHELTKSSKVIFIQRAINEYFIRNIPMVQEKGQKVIYDIDDNLFDIPATNSAYKAFPTKILKDTKKIIGLCDAVTVSTEPLKQYFLRNKIANNIFVIPNFMLSIPEYRDFNNDKIIIGYHGTNTHKGDFDYRLVKALREILEEYDNVEFVAVGYCPIPEANDKIKFIPLVPVDEFFDTIYNIKFDIGLAPIVDNEFNRCKSNIKFLENSACSAATIASNVYPYSNTITHRENGLLVKDDRDWKRYLVELIENSIYRKQLAKSANNLVSKKYTYENNGSYIDEMYTKVLESIL